MVKPWNFLESRTQVGFDLEDLIFFYFSQIFDSSRIYFLFQFFIFSFHNLYSEKNKKNKLNLEKNKVFVL